MENINVQGLCDCQQEKDGEGKTVFTRVMIPGGIKVIPKMAARIKEKTYLAYENGGMIGFAVKIETENMSGGFLQAEVVPMEFLKAIE